MKIALIGTGPSRFDFLEEIRSYPAIMTCSKSHDWLLEQGIVPTYHVDIDPKEHKIPSRIDARVKYYVNGVHDTYRAILPNQYSAFRRGTQCGDTALTLAYHLGYREIHCYGFDACGKGDEEFVLEGKSYRVNDNLLGSIHCFEEAAKRLSGVKVTVHGDGLLRAYLDKKYGTKIS